MNTNEQQNAGSAAQEQQNVPGQDSTGNSLNQTGGAGDLNMDSEQQEENNSYASDTDTNEPTEGNAYQGEDTDAGQQGGASSTSNIDGNEDNEPGDETGFDEGDDDLEADDTDIEADDAGFDEGDDDDESDDDNIEAENTAAL